MFRRLLAAAALLSYGVLSALGAGLHALPTMAEHHFPGLGHAHVHGHAHSHGGSCGHVHRTCGAHERTAAKSDEPRPAGWHALDHDQHEHDCPACTFLGQLRAANTASPTLIAESLVDCGEAAIASHNVASSSPRDCFARGPPLHA